MFDSITTAVEDTAVSSIVNVRNAVRRGCDVAKSVAHEDIDKSEYSSLPFFAQSWYGYDEGTGMFKRDNFQIVLDSVLFVLASAMVVTMGLLLFSVPVAYMTAELNREFSDMVDMASGFVGMVTDVRHSVGDYLTTFEWSRVLPDLASVSESVIRSFGVWLSR